MNDCYVAGLFDGEGCVGISRWPKPGSRHVRYALFVSIGMTYRPIIEAIATEYNGFYHENRHDLRNKKHRIQFNCVFGSQIAATFLRRLLPYAIVKREEIIVALELQDNIDQNPYHPGKKQENRQELLAIREDIYQRLSALKKTRYKSFTA